MKKVLKVILALGLVFMMAGCGSKAQTATFNYSSNGVDVKMVADAEGDTITKLTQTSTINTKNFNSSQIKQLKKVVEESKDTYKNIKGITYKAEESGDKIVETIIIPTDEETLKTVISKGLLPVTGSSGEVTKLSLDKTKESLQKAGWTLEE
ncbi:DUF1307 domain-containing protein [Anaerofustis stercorihominis]|uniref:DUF1307 domain-containing protein n=1 Tax=Anaerofustis stercorihominis TaxID=214853 RepID=A0A3E3E280_9FIRM|nr:DUF1307 domain-containing protein [Anaerofustis stercorihominis]RGD75365.1 DUF1307 domain-containing protein [Anaerofustis stercorihominis]